MCSHVLWVAILALFCGTFYFAKGEMRTLYFGAMSPSGSRETFNRRLWLKSVLPRRKDRCPKIGDQDNQFIQERATTEGIRSSPDQSSLERAMTEGILSVCTVIMTNSSKTAYPKQGAFNLPLERLEFAVHTTATTCLEIHGSRHFFDIELRQFSSTIFRKHSPRDSIESLQGIQAAGGRFWLASTTNEIQVGKEGSEAPLMRLNHSADSKEIRKIKLYSMEHAEWSIYTPCN